MYLTPPALAARWSCKPETVLALIKSGRLKAFTLSPPGSRRPRWRITEAAIEAFENPSVEPQAPVAKRPRRKAADVIEFYQ